MLTFEDKWIKRNKYYYRELFHLFSSLISPGKRILDLSCRTPEVFEVLKASECFGVLASDECATRSQESFPGMVWYESRGKVLETGRSFDGIIAADVIDHLSDIPAFCRSLHALCHEESQVVLTWVSPLWDPILHAASRLGLKRPESIHNYLGVIDVINLLSLCDFEVVSDGCAMLIPKRIPLISWVANRFLAKVPLLRRLTTVRYVVAKPGPRRMMSRGLSCSVIIPCYNEEENVAACIRRIPRMGTYTEVIVVDDASSDGTFAAAQAVADTAEHVKVLRMGHNQGKGAAVKYGFDSAEGDVLIILDADMSVDPEILHEVFDCIDQGRAEFVNTTRMVYPMQQRAMRFLNYVGNLMFSTLMSLVVRTRLTDSLCGTKALLKNDYLRMNMDDDRWGDFALLLGASQLGLSIKEIPVQYKDRRAGKSKMRFLGDGFRMLWFIAKRIVKLVHSS